MRTDSALRAPGSADCRCRTWRLDAGQRLDVVTELVREDVGLREIARRAELPLQLAEEPEIE